MNDPLIAVLVILIFLLCIAVVLVVRVGEVVQMLRRIDHTLRSNALSNSLSRIRQ